jgi:uncharacterized membrane protein YhaH (DUF805 family)
MSNNEEERDQATEGADGGTVFFWILWVLGLVLLPFYAFTFFFEAGVVKEGNLGSQISPIVGLVVLLSQLAITVISFKQIRQKLPLSKPYLTLLGGSIIIGLVWAGGCSIMGPWSLH